MMDHEDCPVMSSKPLDPTSEGPMAECASSKWQNSKKMSTGRSQMMSTGDIGGWDAVVN